MYKKIFEGETLKEYYNIINNLFKITLKK